MADENNNSNCVLNFGSLNIDLVYSVPHFLVPGETLACSAFNRYAGGKGLNQSVALARAGVKVFHAGKIGPDGEFLRQTLVDAGVDVSFLLESACPTGNALIEVEDISGGNRILLYPGANRAITEDEIVSVLEKFPAGTILLLQNEISNIPFLINEGYARGFRIMFNPAPCTPDVAEMPLEKIHTLFVNEVEAAQLTGQDQDTDPAVLADLLTTRYPRTDFVLTLGKRGAFYAAGKDVRIFVPAEEVTPVDTTSAGDTFTGYYLAALLRGYDPEKAMAFASKGAGIAVSRPGAARSIPTAEEVFGC